MKRKKKKKETQAFILYLTRCVQCYWRQRNKRPVPRNAWLAGDLALGKSFLDATRSPPCLPERCTELLRPNTVSVVFSGAEINEKRNAFTANEGKRGANMAFIYSFLLNIHTHGTNEQN